MSTGKDEPEYGKSLAIADFGNAVEIDPAAFVTPDAEVTGILLCLSCHDGNITLQSMPSSRSYTQKMGLLALHRAQNIPSLLGLQLRGYAINHPLGIEAKIETGNGLEFVNGTFTVTPQTPYAHFVANYGFPTLAPTMRSNPYGIDEEGRAYLVCITCHNQHVANVYMSQPSSPIGGDKGGRAYSTFFFVNAPYNPDLHVASDQNANSATQFCRQCHFDKSNEANNTYFVPTRFH